MKKYKEYVDDDLLKFLLEQIKYIDVHVEEDSTDKIVSSTNDRLIIDEQLKEKNRMKKYTDTELLEKLFPKLNYSTITSELKDEVDIIVNESFYKDVEKDFAVALQNRINELRKKVRVEATNIAVDKAEDMCGDVVCEDTECIEKCNAEDKDNECCPSEDACEDTDMKRISIDEEGVEHTNRRWGDCTERTYSSREYYELKKEIVEKDHEIWKLKRTVEALEYLIYACIPPDDRSAD